MKVGILTYHGAYNYGAYLQACSLCDRINQEEDMDAEIIDFRMQKEVDYYSDKNWSLKRKILHAKEFRFTMDVYKAFERADFKMGKAKKSSQSLVSDDMDAFDDFVRGKYDVIVAGSDEIWNTNSFRGFPTPYWLPGNIGARKVSYAASSRVDFSKKSVEMQNYVKKILSEFDYIGVRDDVTYDQLDKLMGSEKMQMCCDPSFLSSFEVAKKLPSKVINNKFFDSSKKSILLMTENDSIAQKIVSEVSCDYNILSVYHWHKGCINLADIDPKEWLELINNVDIVLASYFHAICFSIVTKSRFLALETPGKSSKLMDLLSGSCFEKNFVRNASEEITKDRIDKMVVEVIDENSYGLFIDEKKKNVDSFLCALRR